VNSCDSWATLLKCVIDPDPDSDYEKKYEYRSFSFGEFTECECEYELKKKILQSINCILYFILIKILQKKGNFVEGFRVLNLE